MANRMVKPAQHPVGSAAAFAAFVVDELKQLQSGSTSTVLNSTVRTRSSVSAAELSTFSTGGNAALLIEPAGLSELNYLLELLHSRSIPWSILGRGSNILFPDLDLERVLIRLGREFSNALLLVEAQEFAEAEISRTLFSDQFSDQLKAEPVNFPGGDVFTMWAAGGAPLMGLSRRMSGMGLSGLEFAAGIPASLGGAVRMNAGAHGSDLSKVVSRVLISTPKGSKVLDSAALGFSYRHTELANDMVVVAAELKLVAGEQCEVVEKRRHCLEYRKQTQPLHLPSAGSVFRNPNSKMVSGFDETPSAARLLEECGLKGKRIGGVEYSQLHSNWLVKCGEPARSAEVVQLMELGKASVESRFGVSLNPEIILW